MNGRPERADAGDVAAALNLSVAAMPYATHLGIVWNASASEPVLRLPFRHALLGNASVPAIHGGVIAAAIECGAQSWYAAVHGVAVPLQSVIDVQVDYLRSPFDRDTFATCELLRGGKQIAVVQVRCWQDDAESPVATGRVSLRIRR